MSNSDRSPSDVLCCSDTKSRRIEEILGAATQLFAEQGYDQADTQALANRLGVGKGTLYRYFPSKRELFLAAVDRQMNLLHEYISGSVAGMEDPLECVGGVIRAYLEFFQARPDFVELLIQERAHFKDREKPTYFEHREKYIPRWYDLFRELIRQGRMRPLNVEALATVISDLMYGTMFTNFFAARKISAAEQAEDIMDIVLHGTLSDQERNVPKT